MTMTALIEGLHCAPREFRRRPDALALLQRLVYGLVLLGGLAVAPASAEDIDQPDCDKLEHWASHYDKSDTIRLAPKLELSALYRDKLVVPLFGKSVRAWQHDDFSKLHKWLFKCRGDALRRKDRDAQTVLYRAMRSERGAWRVLSTSRRVLADVKKKVGMIIEAPGSPTMPAVLELAKRSLRGEDVAEDLRRLRRLRPYPIIANQARSLKGASDYLSPEQVAGFVTLLDKRGAEIEPQLRASADEMEKARQQLAQVPISRQGLATLSRLAQLPVLDKVTPQQAQSFRSAVREKRWQIDRVLKQRRAKQAAIEAAKPMDAENVLAPLIAGDAVGDVSIRGLRPGMPLLQAKRRLHSSWNFVSNGFGRSSSFVPARSDRARYARKRRTGGKVELDNMGDAVGQIKFTEYYKSMLWSSTVQAWLSKRFGKPDRTKLTPYTRTMGWRTGDRRLLVQVSNRLGALERGAGYKSKIVLSVWNADYEGYAQERKQRCDKIRNTPRNELSMAQVSWFTQNCL